MWILHTHNTPPEAVITREPFRDKWRVVVYTSGASFDEVGRDKFDTLEDAKAWATALVAMR
jgi:hypothetical protein